MGGVFVFLGFFLFVFRALARSFLGFIFRGGASKAGNSSSGESKEQGPTSGGVSRRWRVLWRPRATEKRETDHHCRSESVQ